jgi:hypothetical protein
MKNKTKKLSELQVTFNFVVEKYIQKFEKKHGYQFSDWVSDDIGGIACFIEQYYFNFDDIRYDIDNNVKKGLIFQWQDEGVENGGKDDINFRSYTLGLRYKDLEKLNKISVLKSKKTLKLVVKSEDGLDVQNIVESKYPNCKILSKSKIRTSTSKWDFNYYQDFKIKIKENV